MGYRVNLEKGCLRICSKVRVDLYFSVIQNTIDSMSKLATEVHALGGRRRTGQQRRQAGVKENIVCGVSPRDDRHWAFRVLIYR